MAFTFAVYQSATKCTGNATPGAKALLAYLEDRFPPQTSMGIYSCRPPRGTSSGYSHHAEGRAYDCGCPTAPGSNGMHVVNLLGPHGARLGIDHIIYNLKPWASDRGEPRIWSKAYPAGKVYTGVHPHKDHAHVGLTRSAGANLNYATLVSVLGPTSSLPGPTTPPEEDEVTLKKGDKGPAVTKYQVGLNAWKPGSITQPPDGVFGSETETAVKGYQTAAGLGVTGQIDGVTGSLLLEYVPDRISAATVDSAARAAAEKAQTTANAALVAANKANTSLDKIRSE